MESQLFLERSKTTRTSEGRWVHVLPNEGKGYLLYDALAEKLIGRILFDTDGHWIYDGDALSVDEQEELAGFITGNRREMELLIKTLNENS